MKKIALGTLMFGVFFFSSISSAWTQPFRLGTWSGSLQGRGEYRKTEISADGDKSKFESNLFEEVLELGNRGIEIYDPDLATMDLSGRFGLNQQRFRSDDESNSDNGTVDGYNAILRLLPREATSLELYANRDRLLEARELAGQSDILTEQYGGRLHLRRIYIPSTFEYRQERRDEKFQSAGTVTRRDEDRQIFTYTGERGWLNSDMRIDYEFVDLDDNISPDLGYQTHDGRLTYGLDFGPYLNWHWDTYLRGYSRSGLSDLETWDANTRLRIEHTSDFETGYKYQFLRTKSGNETNDTHRGTFFLVHQLYENLFTDGELVVSREILTGGQRDIYRGALTETYRKKLPADGRLTARLGGYVEYQDQKFDAPTTSVLQESHTFATPIALPIALNNRFVVVSTIVITKTAVGPLPVGCIAPPGPPTPLIEGRDYTLRTTENGVTEIEPISCSGTTAGINPGDTIAVNYTYAVAPDATYLNTFWNAALSVDYGWVRAFYNHEQLKQDLIEGRGSIFLEDRQRDTVGLEFRYEGERIRASVLGEIIFERSNRESYDEYRSRQSLNIILLPNLRVILVGVQSYSEFIRPDKERTWYSGRATLRYRLGNNLFAELFWYEKYLTDTLLDDERETEVALLGQWRFRQIEVRPEFRYIVRRLGGSEFKEYVALVRIIRWF